MNCWKSSHRHLAVVLLSLAAAAGSPCDSQAWAGTKCCRSRPRLTIGGATEEVLSMVDCNSTSGEGGTHHLVQLEWHHSTLIEENHPLDRIFLFSHCINPTNTSLAPSLSTLLYSSDRTHLTSSTTLSYPVASLCSYFGCYGANVGNNLYTFPEAVSSCTATASSSIADVIISTPMLYVVESTAYLESLAVSSTSVGDQLAPSPTTQLAVTLTSYPRDGIMDLPNTTLVASQSSSILPTPSVPTPSPSTESGTPTVPFWVWALVGVSFLLLMATAGSYVYVARVCVSKPRDIMKDMKDLPWHADTWAGNSPLEDNLLAEFLKDPDKLSLYSVHTQYDCIFLDPKLTAVLDEIPSPPEGPPSLPPLIDSGIQEDSGVQEDEHLNTTEEIAASMSNQSSSSGVSMCTSDTTGCGCGSGTSSQSYVTYGSLCTRQTRSQTDDSCETCQLSSS